MASGRFILGEPVRTFETELAELCEIRHAISCNSGTDALWLALQALEIGPGDAVLCPAFSFFATAAAIVRVGATPCSQTSTRSRSTSIRRTRSDAPSRRRTCAPC